MFKRILLALFLLISASCLPFTCNMYDEESRLTSSTPAVVHLYYKNHSCTAFHIGYGRFITAAHCLGEDLFWPEEPISLVDSADKLHFAKLILFDTTRDVMLIATHDFVGPKLELWNTTLDGPIPRGLKIMSMGYPGYYDTDFTFEIGYVKDVTSRTSTKVEMVFSKDITYRGYSGGPVIALRNGKVVGMADAVAERIDMLDKDKDTHQHASLSILISSGELLKFLK